MTKRMNKLIIVDKLNHYNIYFLLLYRVFGFKSIYLDSTLLLKRKFLVTLLDSIDISSIDYSTFKEYDFLSFFNREYDIAIDIYKKIINMNDIDLQHLFNVTNQKKIEVALIDMIRKYLGSVPNLLICADYYRQEYNIFVWHKNNFIIKHINHEYKNLNFFILNFLYNIFFGLYLVSKYVKIKFMNFFAKKEKIITSKCTQENFNNTVIYFPHKGLATGESYEKNFFYSTDINSPFHKNNILHIEYGIFPNTQEYLSIEKYYIENELKYKIMPKLTLKMLFLSTVSFMKKSKTIPMSSTNMLILSLFANVEYYSKNLKLHKDVKLALVGYDYLFPKPLSLSLDISRIKTVAYQERYLSSFIGLGSVLIDIYFTWNKKISERMSKSVSTYIGESIPIGSVKLELFKISDNNTISNKISQLKKVYKKIIIALDYHSAENSSDNKVIQIANWQNNLVFYRDLIKLAASFPDIYIIIRGKDAKWCNLDIYQDVNNIIEEMDNIEINKDYDTYNISYDLIKKSDLVIGRYTSIMEESLSYGIPVISHDYGANFKNSIKKMYDGDCCFEFVSSYPELKRTVQAFLCNQKTINSECIASLYKTIDNPKEKILHTINMLLQKEVKK